MQAFGPGDRARLTFGRIPYCGYWLIVALMLGRCPPIMNVGNRPHRACVAVLGRAGERPLFGFRSFGGSPRLRMTAKKGAGRVVNLARIGGGPQIPRFLQCVACMAAWMRETG
jgi:hypothetical protein